ncbi:MFS general substrate transporter [Dendrothele bispora CBS 962.96]|uniref:MFS general substrate transporter n=1 Tax=Dendrothele bispora (strain CBS 962.96) TaxID=1314807 RepID=A0A4S8M5E1_DENBC|nr:MFS general substrate transporter [Dendrothele bispora CBS 962.96]
MTALSSVDQLPIRPTNDIETQPNASNCPSLSTLRDSCPSHCCKTLKPYDEKTTEEVTQAELSKSRKNLILSVLSGSQFFDIFSASAAIVALPTLRTDLDFAEGTIQWVLSAYTLTLASFMLISGRVSDMFHPKPVFIVGFMVIGLLSIPIGASVDPIMTIVLRGAQGIGAAMNIPSAVALITMTFSETERGRAYSIYGASGALGGCLGLIIGGVVSSKASWRWVFYILAILVIPLAAVAWFVLPGNAAVNEQSQKKRLDWPGVAFLTAGLILFVFAISDGSSSGWNTARVIAPLVISILTISAFFLVERIVKDPALPPHTWINKNFTPLFFYGWTLYWWLFASQMQLVQIFTTLWGTSSLSAAVRCLPLGISGGISPYLAGVIAPKIPRRILLVGAQLFMAIGSVLFALANGEHRYWSYVVPGMILGMIGVGFSYVASTIIVMEGCRKGEEGVVSAVMYTSYQIGATLGLAVAASITIGVNSGLGVDAGTTEQFRGYAAAFWANLGLSGVAILITVLFVRD